jgi:hypothetical protein
MCCVTRLTLHYTSSAKGKQTEAGEHYHKMEGQYAGLVGRRSPLSSFLRKLLIADGTKKHAPKGCVIDP